MRTMIFAGIFALSASTSLAQTDTTPAQAAPEPQATTPTQAAPEATTPETRTPAPEATAPQTTAPADPATANAGGPANLCQELAAFMKAPPPEEPTAPAAAAKPAEAPAKPQAQEPAPAQQAAPAQEGSSALAGTTQAGEGATAKPEEETNSAQQITGQEGVASDAPDESSNEKVAAGSVANAPQKDSRSAPVPPADVTSTPKETVMTVEEAEQLATANDMGACQDMARQMRVAGVAMPPPLIALAALDLQYHQTGAASPQAPQTQEPAPQAQEPAPETQEPAAQPEQ